MSYFFVGVRFWTFVVAKVAYELMNITENGDHVEIMRPISPTTPPPLNRPGSGDHGKLNYPPPLSRPGFWRPRGKFLVLPPPPATESAGWSWRSRKISATTPPPPVSCCAPPRLPALDPPLNWLNGVKTSILKY